jgi:tetratricopeptide (TPR) repeat protein
VNDPSPSPSPRSVLSRRAAFVVVALFLIGIVWALWPSLRRLGVFQARTAGNPLHARDAYADSPYQNVRPGVGYVGDAACARCHREIAAAYRSHPMGRSLAPVGAAGEGPPTSAAAGLPFEAKGVLYTVERRDGHMVHKATRRDRDGSVLGEIEAEVSFALGSGTRGIAYLIERDGFLFQSPIAWFAQPGRWDISPGYGDFTADPNFERPIQPACLSCHTNQFRPVAGMWNRYEPPIFEGHSIGCERCHGPGALHVDRGGSSGESDLTIVNPANLAPALRESVCQQCHLQGSFRFTRAGREPLDFRPGLPWHRFWAVYLMAQGNQGKFEAVGHVEQMESSRCFRASQGQLGCISCHDPHRLPEPSTKAAYYRGRCLECHEQRGCALPSAERQSRGPGEDCVACHMPRPAVTNIPHTAATDHRIPRGGPGSEPEGPRLAPGRPGEIPLVDYHWGLMSEEERRDAARDRGVALGWVARITNAPPLAQVAATQALPLLEAAVRDRPDDLPARESLGHAYRFLDRPEDALRAFEEVLRIEPGRELTLWATGRLLGHLQRPQRARSVLQETIAVNPWRADYRLSLARVCDQAGEWSGAVAACRAAIRLNPDLFEARSLLVRCYLRSGEPEKADVEFRTLLQFYPASREVWQRWYEDQKRSGQGGVDSSTTRRP